MSIENIAYKNKSSLSNDEVNNRANHVISTLSDEIRSKFKGVDLVFNHTLSEITADTDNKIVMNFSWSLNNYTNSISYHTFNNNYDCYLEVIFTIFVDGKYKMSARIYANDDGHNYGFTSSDIVSISEEYNRNTHSSNAQATPVELLDCSLIPGATIRSDPLNISSCCEYSFESLKDAFDRILVSLDIFKTNSYADINRDENIKVSVKNAFELSRGAMPSLADSISKSIIEDLKALGYTRFSTGVSHYDVVAEYAGNILKQSEVNQDIIVVTPANKRLTEYEVEYKIYTGGISDDKLLNVLKLINKLNSIKQFKNETTRFVVCNKYISVSSITSNRTMYGIKNVTKDILKIVNKYAYVFKLVAIGGCDPDIAIELNKELEGK